MLFPKYRRLHHSMERFYNWFHNYYGSIEKSLGPKLDKVINESIINFTGMEFKTVLEYGCGSGLLTLKLARMFKSVDGRDFFRGMIERALNHAKNANITNAGFYTGNILEPAEEQGSYNYVFVSFALHQFSPDKEITILKKLLEIAQKAVIIIDHGKKWDIKTAVVEWL